MAKKKEVTEELPQQETAEAPKKASKKSKKVVPVEEAPAKTFAKATADDFNVILEPMITEKSMALLQNANKVTCKVAKNANKIQIKEAFQRLYQVPVIGVKVSNYAPKSTTRGGRYRGTFPGYKKALITIAEGAAIDLFRE